MVGVCLTGISLIRVVAAVSRSGSAADDLLSLDAVLFLTSTLTSYFALRMGSEVRLHRLERIADISFIAAMSLMTVSCLIITYAVSL